MIKPNVPILQWLLNLFDPPPRKSMSLAQKTGRILVLSGTLVVGSILVAMIGAVGLYLMERGRELGSAPEFLKGVSIIVAGIVVNTICVLVLVQFKHADHKLIPPIPPEGTEPVVQLKVTPKQLAPAGPKPEPTDLPS
jgi:hypothetical protein